MKYGEAMILAYRHVAAGKSTTVALTTQYACQLGCVLPVDRVNTAAHGDVAAFNVDSLTIGHAEQLVTPGGVAPLELWIEFMVAGCFNLRAVAPRMQVALTLRNTSSAAASVIVCFAPLVVA